MKTFEELKQDGILKEHNIPTYQQVQELFESGEKRVGIVQATGTGKSYLSMQWLFDTVLSEPGKHALVLDPLKGIVKQFKELSEKLCRQKGISPYDIPITFARYDELKTLTDEEIKLLDYDYIVIDEFHGLGAEGRGTVAQKLLKANHNAKILGVTATPIRYLDKNRDMGDELFGDNIVRGLNLREAIEQEILPQPDYVMAVYSYSETISMIEDKIKRVKDKTQRELFERNLAKAKQRAENAEGLSEVFARKIQNKNGKFIAFCSDTARMESLEEEIHNGLLAGVNKKVKVYKISYKDKSDNSNKIIKQFEEDKDKDCLKIMLAVDMFNEGIHIKDVDGCFMFRPTISPRIYLQQIGRVLNVRDNPDFHPVIFDVVNNIQCLDMIKQAFADEEMGRSGGGFAGVDDFDALPFKIDGNDVELNDFLTRLNNAVSEQTTSKEQWLAAAERYVKEFGNLDVPQLYIDENTELKIGQWIHATRRKFTTDPNLVREEIVKNLTALDEHWASYANLSHEERDKKIIDGVKAWPKNQTIPPKAVSPLDKNFKLGIHIAVIKNQLRGNLRNQNCYPQDLIDEINEINPYVLMTKKELLKIRDEKILEGVKAWPKNQAIPPKAVSPLDKEFKLGQHILAIKNQLRGNLTNGNRYSQDLIEEIKEINPYIFNTKEELLKIRDTKILEGVKAWPKNQPIPVGSVSPLDKKFKLGMHIKLIKDQIKGVAKSNSYPQDLIDEIKEINPKVLELLDEKLQERDRKIIEGVKAWPKGQLIPPKAASPLDEEFKLGMHIKLIKDQIKGVAKNNRYPQELIDEIKEINPNVLLTQEELLKIRDTKILEGVKAWPKNQPIPTTAVSLLDEEFKLGMHIKTIRQQLKGSAKSNSYSQELIDEINEINPFALQPSKKGSEAEEE